MRHRRACLAEGYFPRLCVPQARLYSSPGRGGKRSRGVRPKVRACLLDGMGTLLRLLPPAPALARALGIDQSTADRAFRAEVAYYLAHQLEGRDAESLADLRR